MKLPAVLLISLLASLSSAVQAGPKVLLKTSLGEITVELDEAKAPETVKNFLSYVNEGYYNKTVFHRVIEGFMIQGGGFVLKEDGSLDKKETKEPIRNEANNGLKNKKGTIAMARTPDPHSASSQFFINHEDNDSLDHTEETPRGWGYAVFGKVVSGLDVVDKIAKVPTGPGSVGDDVPKEPVVIESASVVAE